MTDDEKTAAAYMAKYPGLDTRLSKEQSARLLSSDFGLYVSMGAVHKEYGEQLKSAKENAEGFLKAAAAIGDKQNALIEMVAKLIDPMFQAVMDSQGALITVDFRPTAIVVHLESELRPNTGTAAALRGSKAVAIEQVDTLPAGRTTYGGMMTDDVMFKALGPILLGAVRDAGTKEPEGYTEAFERLRKADPAPASTLSTCRAAAACRSGASPSLLRLLPP